MKKLLLVMTLLISSFSFATPHFSEGEVVLFNYGLKKNIGTIKKIDDNNTIQITPKFSMPSGLLNWKGRYLIPQDRVGILSKLRNEGLSENIKVGKRIVRETNKSYQKFELGKIIYTFTDGTIISQYPLEKYSLSAVDTEGFFYETTDLDDPSLKKDNYALAKPKGSLKAFLGRVEAVFTDDLVMISKGDSYLLEKRENILVSEDLRAKGQSVLYREHTKIFFEKYDAIHGEITNNNKYKYLDDYTPGILVADFSDKVQLVCSYTFYTTGMTLTDIKTVGEANLKNVPILDLKTPNCSFKPKEELVYEMESYPLSSDDFVTISIPSLSSSIADVADFTHSIQNDRRECVKVKVFKEFENGRKMLIFARTQTTGKLLAWSYGARQVPHYYLTSDEDELCN